MIELPSTPTRIRDLADRLRAGYWFLPMMMAAGAVALAFFIFWLDQVAFGYTLFQRVPNPILDTNSFRDLAVLVATSTLAFLGVIFSIMLVPLSIATGQLGPPVLRTFMRNTGTQIVLGLFIGTTFFALTLFGIIPDAARNPPMLSSVALLAIFMVSIAALVYFINEVARSLQASTVINRLSTELQGDIERELPLRPQLEDDFEALEARRAEILAQGIPIRATREGYIRAIDYAELARLARQADTTLALHFESGDFVLRGDTLVCAAPGKPMPNALEDKVRRQFLMGEYRTITQDIDFGLLTLVAVAVRALSAAINDPYTAIMCVQRLGAALALIAERGENLHHLRDADGVLRLLGEPDTFQEHVDLCFHEIRHYGRTSPEVLMALLRIIERIGERTRSEDQRKALRLHAEWIDREAALGGLSPDDLVRVHLEYDRTIAGLRRD